MILHACPECARQYDVTHLAPRTKVRCACGESFEVTWRKPFVVAHLQCANCAGPVERDDTECRYCGTILPERDRQLSSLCPVCFARMHEDARHCGACGTEIRPQALTPIPDGQDCPRCSGELHIRVLEREELIECAACAGIWLDSKRFERVCHEARTNSLGTLLSREPERAIAPTHEQVSYIPCLQCGELMLRQQFRHAGRFSGVIVDFCRDHGIWLDHSELERILTFLRESRDAHAGPAGSGLGLGLPPQIQKRELAELAMEQGRRGRGSSSLLLEALSLIGSIFFDELV